MSSVKETLAVIGSHKQQITLKKLLKKQNKPTDSVISFENIVCVRALPGFSVDLFEVLIGLDNHRPQTYIDHRLDEFYLPVFFSTGKGNMISL